MKRLAALFLLVVVPSVSRAAVVFEHPVLATGPAYQSAWLTPDGLDWDGWCWDAFQFASDQQVTGIEWFGTGANDIESFDVSICPSIAFGSQPDVTAQPYQHWTIMGDASPVYAGTVAGQAIYKYSYAFPIPFNATAGTFYWLQIEAAETGNNSWSWSAGSGGNDRHFALGATFGGGDRMYYIAPNDLAFRLLGEVAGVPGGTGAEFALHGVAPNPARGSHLRVAYTVPDASSARLDLFDLSGRRVAGVDAAAEGAGRHVADLSAGGAIAPGLYFAQLTQGARSSRARIVVVE